MAKRRKMLYRFADSLAVVHLQHAHVGQVRSRIGEDQRKFMLHQFLHLRLFNAEGHHRHSINVALQHASDQSLGARGIVACRSDHDLISLRHGQILELLHQLWEERIGDFRNDQA